MAKPILYAVSPFDADKDYIFKFKYSGNQAVGHTIVIKNNATSAVVYEHNEANPVVSQVLEHKLAGGTLENGVTYSVQIAVIDNKGAMSEYSTTVVFACLSTPVFAFITPTANQEVNNIVLETKLDYSQAQGEVLNSYYVVLYDTNHQLIHQSETFYDTAELGYTLDGLENGKTYYVKAFGETIQGVKIETSDIQFTVEYIRPAAFSAVQAENNWLAGTITVKSNLMLVEGKYDGETVYRDNDKIYLMDGTPVVFDEAFEIGPNFSLQFKIDDFNPGQHILSMGHGVITMTICRGLMYGSKSDQYCVQLTAKTGQYNHIIRSNYFASKNIIINLRRTNGLFSLKVVEVVE